MLFFAFCGQVFLFREKFKNEKNSDFCSLMAKDRSGHILVVGLCCIDTICYVDKYPEEDTDTRVFEMKNTLGGNATNTCMVLNQFENGEGYELLASVPKSNPIIDRSVV